MKLTKIFGVEGIAEWASFYECLSLRFWCRNQKEPGCYMALVPHGRAEVPYEQPVTQDRIDAAIATLEQWYSNWDRMGYVMKDDDPENPKLRKYFGKRQRGQRQNSLFADRLPADALPWYGSPQEMAEDLFRCVPFRAILVENEIRLPEGCQEVKQLFDEMATRYLNTREMQAYLKGKATEMADFWERQITRSKNPDGKNVDPTLLKEFKEIVSYDASWHFRHREIPVYQTYGGAIGQLEAIMKDERLEALFPYLPMQTCNYFDFSDAPPRKI